MARQIKAGKKKRRGRKAVMIQILLAAVVAIAIYSLLPEKESGLAKTMPYTGLNQSSETILRTLVVPQQDSPRSMTVVIGDQVDSGRLQELANMPYEELKSEIGVKNDFAIYFVNGDDTIIQIGNKQCIGSPRAEVDGKRCG